MAYIGRDTDKISNVEVLDNITFDGSSSYTLQKGGSNFTPSSANTLLVSINGVVQAGNFTVSGSTIDFGTAVAGTSTCDFILHYGVGLITTPADGTVTSAKIGSGAVTSAKLSYPLTTFSSTGIDDNATSTAITIDSSEQVGIGTASPVSKLTVDAGNVNGGGAKITSSNQNTYFIIDNTGTGGAEWTLASSSSGSGFGTGSLAFASEGTERMRITSGGGVNVGSGVLSAASVDGDIVVDLGIVIGTYNGDNRIAASSLGGGSATLYIGNAAIQVSSDERLKTNIADTTMSAVDKIKQVRIVDFNWNDPSDTSYNNRNARGTWTGVIAQELIDVFPFAVNAPRKEEDLSIDTESEKKWQVDQAHLVPVLMKAIQEQQTKIEELETRITALENA